MSREEVLLKEYEVCQLEKNSTAANYWTSLQVFLGFIAALGGGIVYIIGTSNVSKLGAFLFTVLAIFIITVLYLMKLWLKRVNHLIGINNQRMQEIEARLGMKKNLFVYALDHWKEESVLPLTRKRIAETWLFKAKDIQAKKEIQNILKEIDEGKVPEIPEKYRPPKVGRNIIVDVFNSFIAFWFVIMVFAFGLFILISISNSHANSLWECLFETI